MPSTTTMAGGKSFKDLDPDKVFETYTVDEIKSLTRQLDQEMDRKREELRTMVGERYRDLMDAAETITRMRDSSSQVESVIDDIQKSTLNLSSLKVVQKVQLDVVDVDESQLALAAQIKLLMDSPEKMWSAVDSHEYLTAAKLYLFARHIHTGLTVTDVLLQLKREKNQSFPVIGRQWAAISHFHEAILSGCQKSISEDNDNDNIVDSLAAIVLLKNTDERQLFQDFLQWRQLELKSKMELKNVSAKTHIIQTCDAIKSCLKTVNCAFANGELKQVLNGLNRQPTLQLFHASSVSPVMAYLPAIVQDFCPSVAEKSVEEKNEQQCYSLKSSCTQWLEKVYELVAKETVQVLSHVHTIEGLANVRKGVYDHLKQDSFQEWQNMCENLLVGKSNLNLWEEFYRHIFRDRVEAIISTLIHGSIYFVQSTLNSKMIISANDEKGEDDVFEFVWSESGLNNSDEKLLALKARAYSPTIQETCGQFDSMLQKLVDDLKSYVNLEKNKTRFLSSFHDEEKRETEPFSLELDNEKILIFVQTTIQSSIQSMIGHYSKSKEDTVGLGRMYQAIPELCPALHSCAAAPKLLSLDDPNAAGYFCQNKSGKNSDPEWQDIKAKLDQESCRLYNIWIQTLRTELKANLEMGLVSSDSDAESDLKLFSVWESIEISEQDETGKTLKSTIRVPQNLSLNGHKSLLKYCRAAYKVGPHSLPPSVQLNLSQEAALAMGQVYHEYCCTNEKLTQNVALQLHFDLQIVIQSMASRDQKGVATKCQEAMDKLEAHIDPFDLSVFSPYMAANVKKSILRDQVLLAVLIPSDRFSLLASIKASSSLQQEQQQDHNLMRLSCNKSVARFPLLPLSNSSNSQKRSSRGDANKSRNTLSAANLQQPTKNSASGGKSGGNTRKRSKSPVARAAGSFFEAMSTSWFGGK